MEVSVEVSALQQDSRLVCLNRADPAQIHSQRYSSGVDCAFCSVISLCRCTVHITSYLCKSGTFRGSPLQIPVTCCTKSCVLFVTVVCFDCHATSKVLSCCSELFIAG